MECGRDETVRSLYEENFDINTIDTDYYVHKINKFRSSHPYIRSNCFRSMIM